MGHRYGAIPDAHDARDFPLLALRPHVPSLPPSWDVRLSAPPIKDQGDEGACVAFASTRANRTAHALAGRPIVDLSEQWLYWQCRWLEHTVGEDAGSMPRDACRVLRKVGCDTEADYPYVAGQYAAHPPENLVAAAPNKISGFYRCHTLLEAKVALVANCGVIIALNVPESFESAAVARTGMVPMPAMSKSGRITERFLGGHCTTIEGWNDGGPGGAPDRNAIGANSWNTSWGDGGFFYLPYDWFDPRLPLVLGIWALVV
jgi:Papain family cysteine protease